MCTIDWLCYKFGCLISVINSNMQYLVTLQSCITNEDCKYVRFGVFKLVFFGAQTCVLEDIRYSRSSKPNI